ncbi:MAG: serine hydrolase domain-containing protein [Actinomycetota bacterium]
MSQPLTRTLAALVLTAGLAAGACAADDDPDGSEPVATTTAPETTSIVDLTPRPTDELADSLYTIVADTGVPALGAAIFDGDGLVSQAVAGVRERGGDAAVTIDDTFHLGSNTKAMTAALVARFDERGGPVGFDTTLAEAFGETTDVHSDYADVTLAQLLSHTGGAPTDDDLELDDSILTLPVEEARALGTRLVLAAPPAAPPGSVSAYSNAGYVVVAAALEEATGQSWEELMRAELFDPLAMDSCGFGPPGTEGAVDQPLGHDAESGEPAWFDHPAVVAPAGGMHCSMADWGRFLVELLNGLDGDSEHLTHASVERLFEVSDVPVPGLDGGAALGWFAIEGPQGTAWFHDGSNTAWYSQAAIVPDIDRVVVAVSNEEATGEQAAAMAFVALSEIDPA